MKQQKTYWDSNCFLAWLKAEPHADLCRGTIEQAEKGSLLIVTSAITLVEVIKLNGRTSIGKDHSAQIIAFFNQEFVRVRNLYLAMAESARRLIWEYRGLGNIDAVHVATAISAKCPVLEIFDKELIKLDGVIGNPPLRIAEPSIPYQRPSFIQED